MKALKLIYDGLASFGFACILFVLLFILTLVGTLEQVDRGLFYVQKEYFESLIAVHRIGGVPVPLPGVYLLLLLLTLNLILGGIVKMRNKKSRLSVLVIHIGIIVLLGGSMIQFLMSNNGNVLLFEGQSAAEYRDYYDWEIAIGELKDDGSITERVVPGIEFIHLPAGKTRQIVSADLPFDLEIQSYLDNALPMPKGPMFETAQKVVDGYFLQPQPLSKEAEQNVAGAYVTIKEKATGAVREAILWGFSEFPLALEIAGKTYALELRKEARPLPFTVTLEKFTRELHPRTNMASNFHSKVTKTDGSVAQQHDIKMNEPLRYKGYTMYQASWGPPDAGPNDKLYSVFAVVRNPADQMPLYACVIITLGMLLHFAQKLMKHIRAENKRLAS